MRYASNAAQMRALDAAVIEAGVPGAALMEVASLGVARAVMDHFGALAAQGVVVVCGPGNNGGDGWGAARWLAGWGVPVAVWPLGVPREGSDAAIFRNAARKLGLPEVTGPESAAVLVDAVFGTGLTRDVQGKTLAVLQAMASHPAPVVAVDVPSGLCSDTGRILGFAVHAERTVTFGRTKVGMWVADGPSRCGVIDVVDIGLSAATAAGGLATLEVVEAADLTPLWPTRPPDGHKGKNGHLAVIAGSAAMAGAAVLCCRGALAAGVGLVTLVAARGALPRLVALPPEVMLRVTSEGDVLQTVPDLGPFTAVVAGPGLAGGEGLATAMGEALARLWRTSPLPLLFDADALAATCPAPGLPRVLTPHPGEAGRMLGRTSVEVALDRLGAAAALGDRGVVLLKGQHTIVHASGLALPSVNPTGNAVLSTGGSGDVLAGLIGGLLARGVAPRDAARIGAFVHGLAAEQLALVRPDGWTASDVAGALRPL